VITQQKIALEAGVSRTLVTRALNDAPGVAEKTRKRILETAQRLGYHALTNREAKMLIRRRYQRPLHTGVIAVLFRATSTNSLFDEPYFRPVFRGIAREAAQAGVDVIFSLAREGHGLRMLEPGVVDGVLCLSPSWARLSNIHERKFPVVSLGFELKGWHGVVPNDAEGIKQATRHLIGQGCRRLAYVGPTQGPTATIPRRHHAFRTTLRRAGLTDHFATFSRDILVLEPEANVAQIKEKWSRLPARQRPDGLVCYNDALAMGAVRAIESLGGCIPDNVKVIGFDAWSDEVDFNPAITSLGFDRELMGREAVRTLLRLREKRENTSPEVVHLPVFFKAGATA
jgi:DNA-binding LacI/PurR family transcriptional regulator